MYLIMLMSFPAFILQLLLVHGPSQKQNPNLLRTVTEECARYFKNPIILKKLSRVVAKGDPDAFMTIIKKLMPSCELQLTEFVAQNGYGLIDPQLPDTAHHNSTLQNFINVTRMELHRNQSAPLLDLCPRQSPHLRGHVDIDLLGKYKFAVLLNS